MVLSLQIYYSGRGVLSLSFTPTIFIFDIYTLFYVLFPPSGLSSPSRLDGGHKIPSRNTIPAKRDGIVNSVSVHVYVFMNVCACSESRARVVCA